MTKAMSIRKIDERTRTLGDMMRLLTEPGTEPGNQHAIKLELLLQQEGQTGLVPVTISEVCSRAGEVSLTFRQLGEEEENSFCDVCGFSYPPEDPCNQH